MKITFLLKKQKFKDIMELNGMIILQNKYKMK